MNSSIYNSQKFSSTNFWNASILHRNFGINMPNFPISRNLQAPTQQNGQTHLNNSLANCRRFVWVSLTIFVKLTLTGLNSRFFSIPASRYSHLKLWKLRYLLDKHLRWAAVLLWNLRSSLPNFFFSLLHKIIVIALPFILATSTNTSTNLLFMRIIRKCVLFKRIIKTEKTKFRP